jgi:putative ABC transport system permease protein
MNWLHRIFSRDRLERELDAELRFHFDRAVAEAMRGGANEAEARRAARLKCGGVEQIKEECRDARGAVWLADSLADVRVAWRGMRKTPVFAIAAVGALALGIGGNTAIFSLVSAAFLRPLPYRNAERLVFATERFNDKLTERVPPPEAAAWASTGIFEAVAGDYQGGPVDIAAQGRAPEPLAYTRVSTNFFSTLGVAPQLGRDFAADECQPGRSRVALLNDALWRRSFGASAAAIGATVLVNDAPFTVVGVLPPGFAFPGAAPPDVITPRPACPAEMVIKSFEYVSVIGRLRPGVSVQQAQARLEVATRQLNAARPDVFQDGWVRNPRDPNWVAVISLQERFSRNYRTSLAVMMGAAMCVLLIVCANVANLFLARATTRQREVAVRAALGASRPRLLRLLLIESLVLSALGGALGVGLACVVAPALKSLLPEAIPLGTPLDWRALAFTAAATVSAALAVGIAPALAASRVDLGVAMKDGAPTAARAGRSLLRRSLAVAQLALSLALLAGAGLLLRSFVKLVRVDMGFDPRNVLAAELKLRPRKAYDAARRAERFRAALAAVTASPGVEAAGLAATPPVTASSAYLFTAVPETGRPTGGIYYGVNAVSPGYFRTLRIPLLAGRLIQEGDNASAPRVVILSRSAARQLFGGGNPLGQRVTGPGPDTGSDGPFWCTVVGVVGDIRHRGYQAEPSADIYQPFEQASRGYMSVVARSHIDPTAVAPALRRAVQLADPEQKIPSVKRIDEMLSDSVAQRRQRAYLLGAFAALSLLVAIVGVYGVVAYSVARRTHEIGVRMTLGAQPRDVLRMVLGEGLKLALAGGAIGLGLSLWLCRTLTSFLFGVGPWDAVTFLAAGGTLAAAVCLASYLPARQATRVDPAAALRRE